MILKILGLLVACYLIAIALVWSFQRSFLYFPSNTGEPHTLGLWTDEGAIVGYSRIPQNPKHVWMFLHGNGGEASGRVYTLQRFDPQDAVFFLEYPGYGLRPGQPSERSINEAAQSAYRLLQNTYSGQPIGVVGESLGSGPASILANEANPPEKIILIVPFDNLASVAAEAMPWLPARLLLKDRWNNTDALKRFKGELRIYAAKYDYVIPNHHASELARSYPNAHFAMYPGEHTNWASYPIVDLSWNRHL